MAEPTRSAMLHALDEWGNYIEQFNRLAPDRAAAFMHGQGFAALQDLLGHVIGWWEEGQCVVRGIRADPAFVYIEPDTDAFNAQLVEKFHAQAEAEVLDHFEKTRLAMLELVEGLPEEMLAQPLIRDWLQADVIEHLEEHRLPV
jgi:hypothetical protein